MGLRIRLLLTILSALVPAGGVLILVDAVISADGSRHLLPLLAAGSASWLSAVLAAEFFVNQPVQSLLKAAQAQATRDAPHLADVPDRGDEIQQLMQLFNRMADVIEEREAERQRFEAELRHQAFHDPLTDLPNRTVFLDRLEHALARTRRTNARAAVLFIDIDNLKAINDSLGHHAGDALLVAVAERLQSCLRSEDTLARLGGDEFTALIEDVREEAAAARIAERMLEALRGPFTVGAIETYVSASIGIALSGPRRDLPDLLLRDADVAMYRAKSGGKGRFCVFHPGMSNQAVHRLQASTDFRRSFDRGELTVVYQPVFDLATQMIWGVKASPQWQHPRLGAQGGADILALAEESGLAVPLARWLLQEACHQGRVWHSAHPNRPPLHLSVDLCSRQILDPGIVDYLRHQLDENQMSPDTLEIGIAGLPTLRDVELAVPVLAEIQRLGVRIAADGFRTGYSALLRIPLSTLIIDDFVLRALFGEGSFTGVVRAVIEFVHTQRVLVAAVGIDTEEQAGVVRALGCDLAAGAYFGRPMSAQAFDSLLAARQSLEGKALDGGRAALDGDVA
jgi:diguanylate cyclase (GGDEF)-like protein